MADSVELDRTASIVVDAAYKVHRALGPGLLEKVYESCMAHELIKAGLNVERQVSVPVLYDGVMFDEGFRLDLLVNDEIICELKAVDQINPVWQAQILSHLKMAKKNIGFLINFNVPRIKEGIKRYRI